MCEKVVIQEHLQRRTVGGQEETPTQEAAQEAEQVVNGQETKVGVYRGESSKTPYTRHGWHIDALKAGKGSFMIDHSTTCKGMDKRFPVTDNMFRMEVVGRDKCPLRRVLREAVRIKDALEFGEVKVATPEEEIEEEIRRKINLLNSKREFYLPVIGSNTQNIM